MFRDFSRLISLVTILFFASSCGQIFNPDKRPPENGQGDVSGKPVGPMATADSVAAILEKTIQKHHLYGDQYPELTVLFMFKGSSTKAKNKITEVGGTIVYDPSLGRGDSHPYLVANLSPELLTNKEFIDSLGLRAASLDLPTQVKRITPMISGHTEHLGENIKKIFVPLEDVGLPELQNKGGDGKDVVVAVIDTGIDASHPLLGGRVTYWADLTRETRIHLTGVETQVDADDFIHLPMGVDEKTGEKIQKKVKVPSKIRGATKFYWGFFDERVLGAQLSDSQKAQEGSGLDINQNGSTDDKFFILVGDMGAKEDALDDVSSYVAFFDTNYNMYIDDKEGEQPLADFNYIKNNETKDVAAYVSFPAGKKIVRFPLLLKKMPEGGLTASLGIDFSGHGTHVAGIVGASGDVNGVPVVGAAPQAKFMALKVCSGLTCTNSAIFKGLIESFYNPYGVIPDVVNISLGSPEQTKKSIFSYLIEDLAAKFGTTFFISASNNGPGYHTINDLGNAGPAVFVGAYVSDKVLQEQYTLNSEVPVTKHNLLFFSSVGPSYTGELRPNIIAPGSAMSATPMVKDGVGMKNGTSMSSPLAAGLTASVLSLAKKTEKFQGFFKKIKEHRQNILFTFPPKEETSMGSLLSWSMAIRAALEDSALYLDATNMGKNNKQLYTRVQQGHGLIQALPAFDRLSEIFDTMISDKKLQYFDFNINGRQAGTYDRGVTPDRKKMFHLAMEDDFELSAMTKLMIQNNDLWVELISVEEQNHKGEVRSFDMSKNNIPFHIIPLGVSNLNQTFQTFRTKLVLGNARQQVFYSGRRLELMKEGHTYVATYNLSQRGRRLFTLVDVVHKPYILSNDKKLVSSSTFFTEEEKYLRNSFFKENTKIGANEFHRYPIAVQENDYEIIFNVGLPPHVTGRAFVQIYDPNGYEIYFGTVNRMPTRTIAPTDQVKIDTRGKSGIYELVISTSSSFWMGETSYDVLVEGKRFGSLNEKLEMTTQGGKAKGNNLPTEYILAVKNDSADEVNLSNVSFTLGSLVRMERLDSYEVMANRLSFRRIRVPLQEGDKKSSTRVKIRIPGLDQNAHFFGRIDHHLYTWDAQKKSFVPKYKASSGYSSSRAFSDIPRPKERDKEPLYVAIETFGHWGETGTYDASRANIVVEAIYQDVYAKNKGYKATYLKDYSQKDNLLFKIEAPKNLGEVKSGENSLPLSPMAESYLSVSLGGTDLNYYVPIYIFE